MPKKGLIHIYTGDGKGKTTASLGLALRARSHGLKVVYTSFHKNPDRWGYQEHTVLEQIGAEVERFAKEHPMCDKDMTNDQLREKCIEGLEWIKKRLSENPPDLMIIDEIIISVRDGYLTEEELLDLLDGKPDLTELVITGRGASEKMIEKADLVTEMKKIKHPYDEGIPARAGIEF